MRRFLQLASNVSTTAPIRHSLIGALPSSEFVASLRSISISAAYLRQRDSSSTRSGGGDKKPRLWEMEREKISGPNSRDKPNSSKRSNSRSLSFANQRSRKPDSSRRVKMQRVLRSENSSGKGSARQFDPLDSQGDEQQGRKDHKSFGSVRQDKDSHRFILDLGNNQVARIDYKPVGRNKIELYHTEVPEQLRGRGIGKALAKGALECAANANYKLKVTCDYLEDYISRFADEKYKKLIE